jgi:hypothetical protein
MFSRAYDENPETAIEKTIGKTDGFIFQDDLSKTLVDLYFDGQEKEANLLLKNYVLGIITETGRNT